MSERRADTHSLGLEGVDGLELGLDVVRHGLELGEDLLRLGDDVLVADELVVVCKVDVRLLLLELRELALGVVGALAERRNLGERVLAQSQVGDLGKISSSSTSSHCERCVWAERAGGVKIDGGGGKMIATARLPVATAKVERPTVRWIQRFAATLSMCLVLVWAGDEFWQPFQPGNSPYRFRLTITFAPHPQCYSPDPLTNRHVSHEKARNASVCAHKFHPQRMRKAASPARPRMHTAKPRFNAEPHCPDPSRSKKASKAAVSGLL